MLRCAYERTRDVKTEGEVAEGGQDKRGNRKTQLDDRLMISTRVGSEERLVMAVHTHSLLDTTRKIEQ